MKNKLFVIQVITVVMVLLGVIMLISGAVLRHLDEESRKTADPAQMPEAYIEEFFSDDDHEPQIEDFIEPEASDNAESSR